MLTLSSLDRYDAATANAILAAAVLSTTANSGLPEDVKRITPYEGEVRTVLDEVRDRLKLDQADASSRGKAAIVDYLSLAIDRRVFATRGIDATLQRVGQLGLLSPSAYDVEQPDVFKNRFYSLSMSKKLVRESIGAPDEVQHLMIENALEDNEKDALSLFLKKSVSNKGKSHWLLLQTVRVGMRQVLQSAWRVFPSDVDLSSVEDPKGVLAAFVEVFGVEMRVGKAEAKFIDHVQYPAGGIQVGWKQPIVGAETFYSWSNRAKTKLENISEIGIAYGINITMYKASLKAHGYSV